MAKKISRPIVYTLLAAVVAGAVVFLTQPDAPVAHKKTRRVTSTTVQKTDEFTEADYNAHFARYSGGARDAFAAVVTPAKPVTVVVKPTPLKVASDQGGWELTAVSTIDGAASAVVENRASGDVAFLKAGDTWHGLRVVQIAPETLVLQNDIGQKTHLSFKTEEPETGPLSASASVPGAPPLPAGQLGAPSQLVPMPIQALPGLPSTAGQTPAFTQGGNQAVGDQSSDQGSGQFGGRRGRRGRQQN